MARATRQMVFGFVLCACVVTATASAAIAADYPPSSPYKGALSLPNGSSVAANGAVAIAGTGCGDSQAVAVAFDATMVKTVTTDAAGAFSTSVAVPSGTQPGMHTVTATNDGCELTADVMVTADASDPGGTLPRTGSSDTLPAAFIAMVGVVLGAALVVVTRRRMRRPAVSSKDA